MTPGISVLLMGHDMALLDDKLTKSFFYFNTNVYFNCIRNAIYTSKSLFHGSYCAE